MPVSRRHFDGVRGRRHGDGHRRAGIHLLVGLRVLAQHGAHRHVGVDLGLGDHVQPQPHQILAAASTWLMPTTFGTSTLPSPEEIQIADGLALLQLGVLLGVLAGHVALRPRRPTAACPPSRYLKPAACDLRLGLGLGQPDDAGHGRHARPARVPVGKDHVGGAGQSQDEDDHQHPGPHAARGRPGCSSGSMTGAGMSGWRRRTCVGWASPARRPAATAAGVMTRVASSVKPAGAATGSPSCTRRRSSSMACAVR